MTTLRAAAELALEALENAEDQLAKPYSTGATCAITVLRAALAEPVQEPVAWGVFGANLHDMFFTEEEAHEMARLKGDGSTVAPLYTSPPQRPAEPVQEPVAWQWLDTGTFRKKLPKTAERGAWNPLYAAPPQRKPLTDEEINAVCAPLGFAQLSPVEVTRAIEQAHGIGSKT